MGTHLCALPTGKHCPRGLIEREGAKSGSLFLSALAPGCPSDAIPTIHRELEVAKVRARAEGNDDDAETAALLPMAGCIFVTSVQNSDYKE
jgi:hypothetical protein